MDKSELYKKLKDVGFESQFIGATPMGKFDDLINLTYPKEDLRHYLYLCEAIYWLREKCPSLRSALVVELEGNVLDYINEINRVKS